MSNIKLFNKWDASGVVVEDLGLKRYLNISPIIVPRTGGRNTTTNFHRNKTTIYERLVNKLQVPGHKGKKHKSTSGRNTGKAYKNQKVVEQVFKILEEKTKQNPIQVFVKAIENAAPRDEITSIEYGGARYPQAVECSPQRRIDIVLRIMVQGSYQKVYGKKAKIVDVLADEILKAYNKDPTSAAMAKKIELERQADASR
ncbi:MAG: 30S ribosomal protein S7 [Candidatus Woesearchaeota archaeon]|nr:MAG: 30S ribosomal protein S7 [Candidatus Woesearchaeota archaeon]